LFYTGEELGHRYQLGQTNQVSINLMLAAIPQEWVQMLIADKTVTKPGKYLRIFQQAKDNFPSFICKLSNTFQPHIPKGLVELNLSQAKSCFTVGLQSKLLIHADVPPEPVWGYLKKMRIVHISRGHHRKLKAFLLYGGVIQDMVLNP
jgi:hypothetical protein